MTNDAFYDILRLVREHICDLLMRKRIYFEMDKRTICAYTFFVNNNICTSEHNKICLHIQRTHVKYVILFNKSLLTITYLGHIISSTSKQLPYLVWYWCHLVPIINYMGFIDPHKQQPKNALPLPQLI